MTIRAEYPEAGEMPPLEIVEQNLVS